MFVAEIDPVQSPLHLWHPDCLTGATDEQLEMFRREHRGIIQFFEAMVAHPSASVIPIYTSMMSLCVGSKKDIITILYFFSEKEISIEYHIKGAVNGCSPDLKFRGCPEDALELIVEQLDFFVSRHKWLGKLGG